MCAQIIRSSGQKLLERLTRPSEKIGSEAQRQQARLLASLAVTLLIAILIIAPIWVIAAPEFTSASGISLTLLLAFGLVYGLSRSRFYYAGAVILVLSFLALVATTILTSPGPLADRMLALKFLIVAIMVSSLFLPRAFTLTISVISLVAIGAFLLIPGAPFVFTYSFLVFFLLTTILGAIGSVLSNRYRKQLAESEARYRSVVAALSEGIVLYMRDGSISACNQAAERILGLTADQMMGRTSVDPRWQAIHEDGSPFPGDQHPAMITLRTGQPLSGVVMGIHHPDGTLRWLSINSQPLLHPGETLPYAVVTSFADITRRKQYEQSLLESRRQYQSLFDQTHDAVFMLDLDGRHRAANHRAADMLGYSDEEIQKLTFRDLSAEIEQSENVRARLLAGEHVPTFERLFRKKDGSLIPVEINVQLVRDLNGSPLHFQSVVRDISERKRVEEVLREQHTLLDRFFSAALDLLCIANRDGYFLRLNKEWENVLGYSLVELQERQFLDFVHPDDLQATQEALAHLDAQKPLLNFTNRYRAKDGSYRFIEWRSYPHHHLIYATARDITERKQAEETLRENEMRLKMTLEGTRAGTWEWNVQTGETIFNPRWAEIVGYTLDELAPISIQTWINLTHPDDLVLSDQQLKKHFARQTAHYECEVRMKHKEGHWVWVWDRGMVLEWTADGQPLRMFGIHIDITEHKLAEQALYEQHAELDRFFTVALDLLCIADMDGYFVKVNKAWGDLLGCPLEDVQGRHILDFVHPDDVESTRTALATLGEQHPVLNFVNRCRTHNGGYRFIEWQASPLGKRIYVAARDITERKQAEDVLRESEMRYRSMFENNQAIKLLINPDTGQILDANTAAAQFYGYSIEQLKTMHIQDINMLSEAEVKAEMALARSEKRRVFYFRHRLASGEIRDVEVFSGPITIRGQQFLYSIILDVTARKQAEQALLQSEARQRALLNAIPDLVFRNHRDGTYLDCYAGNNADLMTSPQHFIGRKITEVMPPEFAAQHIYFLERTLETGEEQTYEYVLPVAGQMKDYEARMVVAGPDEVLTIVRDITERKRAAQREFELALQHERVRLLQQFVESASHEFRTPLSIIRTSTYLMTRTDDEDKRRQRMTAIETQVNRMTQLVDMLLLMTRLESGTVNPYVSLRLSLIVNVVCDKLARQYEYSPTLRREGLINLPPVLGDPDDLSEALTQILDNAYRFTPADGLIRVVTGVTGNHVWIAIHDTGPGIPEDHLPHLFETFWRHDEAHSTPGLGLGLPIAQKIVQMHGGCIEVESQVGCGSVFRILLPIASSED
jgi:PAS domain S-box-containing protein